MCGSGGSFHISWSTLRWCSKSTSEGVNRAEIPNQEARTPPAMSAASLPTLAPAARPIPPGMIPAMPPNRIEAMVNRLMRAVSISSMRSATWSARSRSQVSSAVEDVISNHVNRRRSVSAAAGLPSQDGRVESSPSGRQCDSREGPPLPA